jgi:hypothetical protein
MRRIIIPKKSDEMKNKVKELSDKYLNKIKER